MNAKLINVTPENLHEHAEVCSKAISLMLDFSKQVAELQFASMQKSLLLARQQVSMIRHDDASSWIKSGVSTSEQMLAELFSVSQEMARLGQQSQGAAKVLAQQSFSQVNEILRQLSETQSSLLAGISTAFSQEK